MSKSGKTELYKSFLEAFKNAYPTLPKASVYNKGQAAWNEMKLDQAKVQEKIHDWKAMAAKHHSQKLAVWAGFFKSPQQSSSDPSREALTGSKVSEVSTEQGQPRPFEQKPPVEETSSEPNDSRPAKRKQPMEEPITVTEISHQPRQQSTETSTEPNESGPAERKRQIMTPAQDKIKEELNSLNPEILYIHSIKNSCGLSANLSKKLKRCEKEKQELERKWKRKLSDAKAQAKARGKRLLK